MLIIGHRGAKGLAPENTLASLQAALDAGVDGIEFDVRVSKDGTALLNHNSDIGVPGPDLDIAKTDFKDLQAAKPSLTTLEQAMDLLAGKTTVVIEVKRSRSLQPIVDTIRTCLENGWDADDISLSSFSYKYLKVFSHELPEIRLIVNDTWSGVRATRRARKLGTTHITMNQRWLWGGFIKSIARGGYKLSAYTINNSAKARRWQKHGLYAVITDFPDRFV